MQDMFTLEKYESSLEVHVKVIALHFKSMQLGVVLYSYLLTTKYNIPNYVKKYHKTVAPRIYLNIKSN